MTKILISTPLFPPEVAYPAAFSKKLAKHLSACGYDVVVATFSDFPEKIEGVEVLHVKKSHNIFVRLILFYLLLFKLFYSSPFGGGREGGVDIVILKQAGFSSFLTLVVAIIFRVKTVLKMKEDEVEVRVKNQKVSADSFVVWRVKKLQQFIFKHVNFILFDNESLKSKILKEYNLSGQNIGVLAHPSADDILHYGDDAEFRRIESDRAGEWEKYTNEFIKYAK
jgi:hypothetical protein